MCTVLRARGMQISDTQTLAEAFIYVSINNSELTAGASELGAITQELVPLPISIPTASMALTISRIVWASTLLPAKIPIA